MKIQIEVDTSTATAADYQMLNRLASAVSDQDWPSAAETVEAEPAKPAPAKKAAAKKPEPEPEAEADEEVVEAEIVEDDDDALMEQAVQKATKLVSDGKASEVKAALEKAGARRVSELKGGDNIRKFLEAL